MLNRLDWTGRHGRPKSFIVRTSRRRLECWAWAECLFQFPLIRLRCWSTCQRSLMMTSFNLLHVVPRLRLNKRFLDMKSILTVFKVRYHNGFHGCRLNWAWSNGGSQVSWRLWESFLKLTVCKFPVFSLLVVSSSEIAVRVKMPIGLLLIDYLGAIRFCKYSLPSWWLRSNCSLRRHLNSKLNSRFNCVLELKVLVDSLFFIFGIES